MSFNGGILGFVWRPQASCVEEWESPDLFRERSTQTVRAEAISCVKELLIGHALKSTAMEQTCARKTPQGTDAHRFCRPTRWCTVRQR